jgi:hypothetical protein
MLAKVDKLKTESYSVHGSEYELTVYKSRNSGEILINVSKEEREKSTLWSLKDLEISAEMKNENELIESCLAMAKSAIRENESEA